MTHETQENTGKQTAAAGRTARSTANVPAELVEPGRTLTARQENFARLYAAGQPATDAYAAAYTADGSSRATLRVNAARLLHNPRVATRIRELQDAAATASVRSTAALVAELEEAVAADPN